MEQQNDKSIQRGRFTFRLAFTMLLTVLALVVAGCEGADLSATDCSRDTFVVNSTEDISDGACNDGNCTLREAVEAANTCTVHPSYTIILPEGEYELMLRGPGDERGDLDLRRHVTIAQREGDTALPVIKGPDSWNDRIFHVHPSVEANLDSLWIRGGNASANGGGILNQGILDIDRAIISDNRTSRDGGGLANEGLATMQYVEFFQNFANPVDYTTCGGALLNTGQVVMVDSTIHQGDAYTGAAICNQAEPGGSLTLRGTWIEKNGGTVPGISGLGGGIASFRGPVTLEGTTIIENVALRGGGFYATNGEIQITDSTISENRAGFGGGLFIGPSARNVRIQGTTVEANLAERMRDRTGDWSGGLGGGAVVLTNSFDIFESPFLSNTAETLGGGLYVDATPLSQGYFSYGPLAYNSSPNGTGGAVAIVRGRVLIANATISNNEALDYGVALNNGSAAETRLVHVTIADNSVLEGESEYPVNNEDGGQLVFRNSLLLGRGRGGGCWGDRSGITSEGGNTISYLSLCPSNTRTDDESITPGLRYARANIIMPLTEVDGTLLHPLPPFSPAVDFVASPRCNRDDQRLASRPQGEGCEAGAYELSLEAMSAPITPVPFETVTPSEPTATPTSQFACPAASAFTEAAFRNISYRQGQGETLVVLDVPGVMTQQEYPASINGQEFVCSQSADFEERLFCIGPRLVEGAPAAFQLFAEGCSQPVFETSFSVPLPLYPTPTPTLAPSPTCDPQQQQCN